MKKLYFILVGILLTTISNAQNPVPNPSFETWIGTPLAPDPWYSNGFPGQVTLTQASGYTGTYAAQGDVVANAFPPPLLVEPYFGCTFPVTQFYNTMQFYYKVFLDSGDVFQVSTVIRDGNGAFVAVNYGEIDASIGTFTQYSLHLDLVGAGIPDNALMVFTILPAPTATEVHDASYFVVDDVELLNTTIGINTTTARNELSVFPNPANEKIIIHFDTKDNSPIQLQLTDLIGRIVLQKESVIPQNGRIEEVLEVEDLQPGVYSLLLNSKEGKLVSKVVVE